MTDINRCECGSFNLKVTDSRQHENTIWRTRVCCDCGKRFYTVEVDRAEYKRITKVEKIFKILTELMEGNNDS